jgi:hypothetical protein
VISWRGCEIKLTNPALVQKYIAVQALQDKMQAEASLDMYEYIIGAYWDATQLIDTLTHESHVLLTYIGTKYLI